MDVSPHPPGPLLPQEEKGEKTSASRADLTMERSSDVVMDVRGLTKLFPAGRGSFLGLGRQRRFIHAVEDVSFTLRAGQILALVGESGTGKTPTARVLPALYP